MRNKFDEAKWSKTEKRKKLGTGLRMRLNRYRGNKSNGYCISGAVRMIFIRNFLGRGVETLRAFPELFHFGSRLSTVLQSGGTYCESAATKLPNLGAYAPSIFRAVSGPSRSDDKAWTFKRSRSVLDTDEVCCLCHTRIIKKKKN